MPKPCDESILKDQNLIYFSPGPWDDLWRNRQQLMAVFARYNTVLFVEPQQHLRPTISRFQRGDYQPHHLFQASIRHVQDNLYRFRYPVWAPISGQPPLKQLTQAVRARAFRAALKQLHMTEPIVWLALPGLVNVLDEIPSPRLLIYHVVDEYTAYAGQTEAARRLTRQQEQQLLPRADVVIAVSQALCEAKQPHNANTYLVPNGVNFTAYSKALADPALPPSLAAIPEPRLGYIGLIGDKLNYEILKTLAEENPAWSIVMMGTIRLKVQEDSWQMFQALPNVHHLPSVSVDQVPHYVKGFQAGLMPYLQNRHAQNISPLKLYDYLAAGLPVASVDIPAAQLFQEVVHLAETPADFLAAARAALADTSQEAFQARCALAAQHTWEARVAQISGIIEQNLG